MQSRNISNRFLPKRNIMKFSIKKYSLIGLIFPLQLLSMQRNSDEQMSSLIQKFYNFTGQMKTNYTESQSTVINMKPHTDMPNETDFNSKNYSDNNSTLNSIAPQRIDHTESEQSIMMTDHQQIFAQERPYQLQAFPIAEPQTISVNSNIVTDRTVTQSEGTRNFIKRVKPLLQPGYAKYGKSSPYVIELLRKTDSAIYLNARFDNNSTLLHQVASVGALRAVQYLIDIHHFDPLETDDNGKNALNYAEQCTIKTAGKTKKYLAQVTGAIGITHDNLTEKKQTRTPRKKREKNDRSRKNTECIEKILNSYEKNFLSHKEILQGIINRFSGTHMGNGSFNDAVQGACDRFNISSETLESIPFDKNGNTIIHIAAIHSQKNLLDYLHTTKKINTSIKNADGQTPCQLAPDGSLTALYLKDWEHINPT